MIMHERLELNEKRALLARQYTERLITEAVLHGDKHKETMEVGHCCTGLCFVKDTEG